jgi:hypothetical protein
VQGLGQLVGGLTDQLDTPPGLEHWTPTAPPTLLGHAHWTPTAPPTLPGQGYWTHAEPGNDQSHGQGLGHDHVLGHGFGPDRHGRPHAHRHESHHGPRR